MNKNLAHLALLVQATHAVPRTLTAQSHRDTVMVQAGALRFVRANVRGHGAIAVDTTGHFAAIPTARPETLREAVTAAKVAARLGSTSDFVICENPRAYKTCTLNGVDAVADFATSYFRADSAYVRVRIKERAAPAPQVAERVYVVRFVKKGAAWEYAGATLRSQS